MVAIHVDCVVKEALLKYSAAGVHGVVDPVELSQTRQILAEHQFLPLIKVNSRCVWLWDKAQILIKNVFTEDSAHAVRVQLIASLIPV